MLLTWPSHICQEIHNYSPLATHIKANIYTQQHKFNTCPSTETCIKDPKAPVSEATDDESADQVEELRRSERRRTLTEKGKEKKEEKLKSVKRRYRITYEKWRYHARLAKEILTDQMPQMKS